MNGPWRSQNFQALNDLLYTFLYFCSSFCIPLLYCTVLCFVVGHLEHTRYPGFLATYPSVTLIPCSPVRSFTQLITASVFVSMKTRKTIPIREYFMFVKGFILCCQRATNAFATTCIQPINCARFRHYTLCSAHYSLLSVRDSKRHLSLSQSLHTWMAMRMT